MSRSEESLAAGSGGGSLPVDHTVETFPEPAAHGASVGNVLNDLSPSDADNHPTNRDTLYAESVEWWRENVGDRDNEPYVATEFSPEWLDESREWVLQVKSSGWKAGTGHGDSYSQYYQQHLVLRERVVEDGDERLRKPPTALHVEIMPQYRDLVYKSGDPLECPYGEGTRVVAWTTWAESAGEVERRMYDAIRAVYGNDAVNVTRDRDPDSRRIQKAEAHVRFDIDKKGAAVETVEHSKQLIDWGGRSEIEAGQTRVKEGWLEAVLESDRWDLLGFRDVPFETELKIYQMSEWHKRPRSDPFKHPKLEASFAGADGRLPHADDWDAVMDHLRTVVGTHARWAGIEASDLVEDEKFDGAGAERYEFQMPTGRREHLRRRYEDVATEVYREALKDSTTAVYDILRVIAVETGATYDTLVERTGLARSTVRYHVARLAREGVVKRLGNPVLVVFVSRDLLERAREILERARPERTAEDIREDAEERRERRESREATNGDDAEEIEDEQEDHERDRWCYLADVEHSLREIAVALHGDGEITSQDIRVRDRCLPARGGG